MYNNTNYNDAHYYDTKLKEEYKRLVNIDNCFLCPPMSFDDTIIDIQNRLNLDYNMNKLLDEDTINKAKTVLDLVVKDRINNYDILNDIHFEDLLPRVWRFLKNYDSEGLVIFYEQLKEITSGSFPQGRTTRIFQFYNIHMNNKDEIFVQNLKR